MNSRRPLLPRPGAALLVAVVVCATSLVAVPLAAAAGTAGAVTPDAAGTTWLCRPGQAPDPCLLPEGAISVAANGSRTTLTAQPAAASAFDCFYVYPTVVASAATSNSGLTVNAAEVAAAAAQASRFSQVCNVWAPTYRQRTSASLLAGLGADQAANNISYESLLAGWTDYLDNYNDGRPVIFIGHSQGAVNLIRLLQAQVENDPALRSRMVSAIIVGGNVQVPVGKRVGGTFSDIPACTSSREMGCVIAYSSFSTSPPADANFGRPGQGVSLQAGQTAKKGQQVLCTNPADLASAAWSPLTSYFLGKNALSATPWLTYPGLYMAKCESKDGATWLQIDVHHRGGRPVVTPTLGPTWGLHLYDINLALGNLVDDVRAQEATYQHEHGSS